ncbi:hypothetical protein LTR85_005947 [Meristemomyces frigidus]|nr:hypothetical protein LTR85_005947 [Meristemomyces frigidus]
MAEFQPREPLLRPSRPILPHLPRSDQPESTATGGDMVPSPSAMTHLSQEGSILLPFKNKTFHPACSTETEEETEIYDAHEQELDDEYARAIGLQGIELQRLQHSARANNEGGTAPGYAASRVKYEPIEVPKGYPHLDFRPTLLSLSGTLALIVLYLGIIAGMFALLYCRGSAPAYEVENVNYYFSAHYGPSLVGALTGVLVKATLQEVRRMYPYVSMADRKAGRFASARAADSNDCALFPKPAGNSKLHLAIILLQLSTSLLMTGKLALVQVVRRDSDQGWSVVVHRDIVYALTAYYTIQIGVLLRIIQWLWSRDTGLRTEWDPTSLADIMTLFHPFRNTDIAHPEQERYRLGYWQRTEGSEVTVVYGIRAREHPADSDTPPSPKATVKGHREKSSTTAESPYHRFPILWNTLMNGWSFLFILGIAGLITATWAGILASPSRSRLSLFTHGSFEWANATLTNNTLPVEVNLTSSGEISFLSGPDDLVAQVQLWNFILRGLPQFFVSSALGQSAVFDLFYLYCQPFVDMYRGPSSAAKSILLDYLTISPLKVLLEAHQHGHWKVLYFKILALLAPVVQLAPVSVLTVFGTKDAMGPILD